ncbi:MAG TPA: hypothetical protein PLH22_00700 [Candidatus Colwellbacteria bacterium]|mgnify:CR=1 FL=1|jgi:transcription elongation GreA/GreB family factor|nr:hypothetical protein [Candidatus Colwellbacteria bacterium]
MESPPRTSSRSCLSPRLLPKDREALPAEISRIEGTITKLQEDLESAKEDGETACRIRDEIAKKREELKHLFDLQRCAVLISRPPSDEVAMIGHRVTYHNVCSGESMAIVLGGDWVPNAERCQRTTARTPLFAALQGAKCDERRVLFTDKPKTIVIDRIEAADDE